MRREEAHRHPSRDGKRTPPESCCGVAKPIRRRSPWWRNPHRLPRRSLAAPRNSSPTSGRSRAPPLPRAAIRTARRNGRAQTPSRPPPRATGSSRPQSRATNQTKTLPRSDGPFVAEEEGSERAPKLRVFINLYKSKTRFALRRLVLGPTKRSLS